MSEKQITLQEWRELYAVAIALKKLKPWEWMWDSEIFGVQDPETGEVGYCCVMGRLGEHFGLAVYRGSEGLEGYMKVQSGDVDAYSSDALHYQKCLMVSFEDRDFLAPKDRKIVKQLGLKFRGDNAWPLFRDWTPGYHPWFITPEETRYLIQLIPQAIDVTERFKQDLALLAPPQPGRYLVRVPRLGPDGLIWEDEWKEPVPPPEPGPVDALFDSSSLEKIRETITRRAGIWEIDYFYSSETVREKQERPYFPRMMLCVDHETGLILFFHLVSAHSQWINEFIEAFLEKLEKLGSLPGKILVKENGFALFKTAAAGLEVETEVVDDLPVINEVRAHMEQFGKQKQ
ncbi:MAG: hypothetical protein V1789_11255 [PVC group bacterium]